VPRDGAAVDKVLFGHTWLNSPLYERAMLAMMMRRLGPAAVLLMRLAIALSAMWMMLGVGGIIELAERSCTNVSGL
jgi:hypothetical protein